MDFDRESDGRVDGDSTRGTEDSAGSKRGTGSSGAPGGAEQPGREPIGDRMDDGGEALRRAAESGRNRVAGQLERMGERLAERGRDMERAGGVQRRASRVAARASEALDSGAEYIRSRDPQEMRDDLERSIRAKPLLSVGIALGAGFLLARLLRE